MASKRRIRRKSCDGKIRYDTADAASKGRSSLNRAKGYQGFMNVYRCSFCGGYHIGHAVDKRGTWGR